MKEVIQAAKSTYVERIKKSLFVHFPPTTYDFWVKFFFNLAATKESDTERLIYITLKNLIINYEDNTPGDPICFQDYEAFAFLAFFDSIKLNWKISKAIPSDLVLLQRIADEIREEVERIE